MGKLTRKEVDKAISEILEPTIAPVVAQQSRAQVPVGQQGQAPVGSLEKLLIAAKQQQLKAPVRELPKA